MHCSPHHPAFQVEVWAEVPFPGHPLGIAVDRDTIYVATHRDITNQPDVASHIYAYNRHGDITADFTVKGQIHPVQGISGLALDHDGILYAVDQSPSRVITLDPRTGEQTTYAELPDVPLCEGDARDAGCSAATADRPAAPINLAFDPDGNLYIGDLTQALIWRVPPGGGTGEVWYTASDMDSLFGPNTVRFLDHGRTLLLAESAHDLQDPDELANARGRLYTLDIGRDGRPGQRRLFWEGGPGETPDGFAVSRSGTVYVALAVASTLLVLSRDGREITRLPAASQDNEEPQVPFDLLGGVAFHDNQLLITNQAFLGGPAAHQVIFSVTVHERGKRLFRPRIRRADPASTGSAADGRPI
ncbi:SMP-30/gluconolactonase/LRE family protein [Streptomyces sp. MP131-18]|uniref:SMP-30/gluconolactonase/LRE family protein n=1 Tax=Streptomyces sp. MP131-18 TaxID=1857892 RepID=UPI00097BF9EC|nr:SMP-30/gluconolactonase/LRE family protein [Streptomyces sp. MP131-18]ONK13120.1 Gluconolactonase [Streptomyces sp. MP131-18]